MTRPCTPPAAQRAPPARPGGVDRLTRRALELRWLYVVPVVLPLSLLFDALWAVRAAWRRWRRAPQHHDRRVGAIQAEVRALAASAPAEGLCTTRPGYLSIATRIARYKRRDNAVRVSLHDILGVDAERRLVHVEPRVTVGELVRYLLPLGWTLPVVPELDDLTVGGLLLGYGIEVSSHRHGLLKDNVERCEVVLGDGRRVHCSREEHADLFHALPWSHGALGIVVGVTLRLVPARRFVRVRYRPFTDRGALIRAFSQAVTGDDAPEFVEGFQFDRERGVLVTGEPVDEARGRVYRAARWHAPWFHAHARGFLERGEDEEYVPLRDFYRRHERGMYWESGLIVPFGNHPLFRWALGWLMPPKIAFLKLTQSRRILRFYVEQHVLQDALVPLARLDAALERFDALFDAYPLWLCAARNVRTSPPGMLHPGADEPGDGMLVDVGLFLTPGPVLRGEACDARDAVREMSRWLIGHGGWQALYAWHDLTRDDFRRMFDLTLYDAVRERYGAGGVFMDVHDKVRWREHA